jgi:iron uptake system component EfeO
MLAAAVVSIVLECGRESPSHAEAIEPPQVVIELTEKSCKPSELTVPAGRVAFSVRNSTAIASEWEILDGVMVIAERENIQPGATRSLTARLLPGEYQITCGLIGNPQGRLHVVGQGHEVLRVRQTEIIGPLAEYRVFVSDELDALVDELGRLSDATNLGRLQDARRLFIEAHAHYARAASVALYFPDLDGAVDPTLATTDPGKLDPLYLGFNQLAWELFEHANPLTLSIVTAKLSRDATAMRVRFQALSISAAPTFAGAAQALGTVTPSEDTGWRGRVAMANLQASIDGVRKIFELFQPLIARSDLPLTHSLADDFAKLNVAVTRLAVEDPGANGGLDQRSEDRNLVKTLTRKLTEEIGRVPLALGFG